LDGQKRFLEKLGVDLGIGAREGWYAISSKRFVEIGGKRLLRRYNDSISAMLSSVFPDYAWEPLRFTKVPQNYWASTSNQRLFLDDLATKSAFHTSVHFLLSPFDIYVVVFIITCTFLF